MRKAIIIFWQLGTGGGGGGEGEAPKKITIRLKSTLNIQLLAFIELFVEQSLWCRLSTRIGLHCLILLEK